MKAIEVKLALAVAGSIAALVAAARQETKA